MKILNSIFGSKNDKEVKALYKEVEKINQLETKMEALSDDDLKNQTNLFKERIKNGESLDNLMIEAFATVREASKRVLKLRHYDVQMLGGIVLFQGRIAEMKTGEGKTLTATLPLYLVGLEGKGAHLVTVNDYLASRDAEEMGVLYNWLGLTCGCILTDMTDEERQAAYGSDITYGTNNEFGFDYLRDNMKFDLDQYVQRDHHYCIVDEVDSILIDEARTPLIISGPSEGDTSLYGKASKVIPQLKKDEHYTVDEKSSTAVLTEEGITELTNILKIDDLYDIKNMELLHCLNQALRAHTLFQKDTHYVVNDGKVIIVDEFTGRLKTGSRWSDGLHQSVEAKEGVEIKQENQTLASITFQNYFKMYSKLSGMTGTAETEEEEFKKIYALSVVVVPTNKPLVRDDQADIIYKSKTAKYKAAAKHIQEHHEKGQPVLVGTISIESSEELAKYLNQLKVPFEILNAKQHEREAQIIAKAGHKGSVTIATNMAGRGTDIKLTPETLELGGLFILGTERHESRRIDNQLRGRSGRQGDPGKSKFLLSLEDDLLRIFGSDRIKNVMNFVGMEEDEPIESKMVSKQIEKAQMKVEKHNFDIRKHLLDYDNVMNEQRRVIYKIRRDILNDNDNMGFVKEMIQDVAEFMEDTYRPERKVPIESWPWEDMKQGFKNIFHTDYLINVAECSSNYDGILANYIQSKAEEILDQKFSEYEEEQVKLALREILLSLFDRFWKDHLQNMDNLREGINLHAYAQKDPLNEYKLRSFQLFEDMRQEIKKAVIDNMFSAKLYTQEEIEELKRQQEALLEAQLEAHKEAQRLEESGRKKPVTRKTVKTGRNEPCPCGSGKKFKHCHGA